jgi:hypothetical protein
VNRPGNHEGLLASVNFRRGGVIRAATITSGAPPNRWRLIGFRLRVIPVFWRAFSAQTDLPAIPPQAARTAGIW